MNRTLLLSYKLKSHFHSRVAPTNCEGQKVRGSLKYIVC